MFGLRGLQTFVMSLLSVAFLNALMAPTAGAKEAPLEAPLFVAEVAEQAASQAPTSACLLEDMQLEKTLCRLSGEYRALEIESQYGELVARLERPSGAHDLVSLRGFLREQDLDSDLGNVESGGASGEAGTASAAGESFAALPIAGASELMPLSTSPVQMPEWQEQLMKFETLQGARYQIPTSGAELKTSLGFDAQAEIAATDWLEVLKVHLERTLGIDPETSESIVELLGVSSDPVVVETN